LPYHFLLVGGSETGYLHWLDVSIGKMVSSTKMLHAYGKFTTLTQNSSNAIIHTGHPNGTVALWSPNEKEPLVKILAQACPVSGLAIDHTGNYMATTGADRSLKIYDLRNTYKCLSSYKLRTPPNGLDFSQKNMLAVALGPVVEVYRDVHLGQIVEPYLRHKTGSNISDLKFCNFEDVLGVGNGGGFTSCLVPGAGEANFDAFEANPFMTISQRKEMEVKALLEKIQPELITLDSTDLSKVNRFSLHETIEAKEKIRHVKTKEIEFESKRKTKSAKKNRIKVGLKNEMKKHEIRSLIKMKKQAKAAQEAAPKVLKNTLDRFKSS
jgi:U3 small nucleolar RNA-associated protein 7